jgi:hypothetical protein
VSDYEVRGKTICEVCGEALQPEKFDEFTPADLSNGVNIPVESIDDSEEQHIFWETDTLIIHYSEVQQS